MGRAAVGTPNTHHLEKSEGVMLLSNALVTSAASLQACPVPSADPPSVLSRLAGSPHTLARPSPPHDSGCVHLPHRTVRKVPQLSLAVTVPQFLPLRAQHSPFRRGSHPPRRPATSPSS